MIEEANEGRQWKSVWPSKVDLLPRYPFLSVQSSTLTFADASKLLISYKELVLQYEILELALRRRIRPSNWSATDSAVLPDLETDSTMMDNQEWHEGQAESLSRENSLSNIKAVVQDQPEEERQSEVQPKNGQIVGQSPENSTTDEAVPEIEDLNDCESSTGTSTKTDSRPATADGSISSQLSRRVEWDEGPSNGHLVAGESKEESVTTEPALATDRVSGVPGTIEIKGMMQDPFEVGAEETAVSHSSPKSDITFSNNVPDSSVSLNAKLNDEDPPTPTFQHTKSFIDL